MREHFGGNNYKLRKDRFMLAPNPSKPYGVFNSLISAFREWTRNRRLIRQSRLRLNGCDSYEVARIAREAGVSVSDLRQLSQLGPDAAKLVLDRMAAQNLDAEALASSDPCTMRDLQRLCSTCASKKRCQRDLITDRDNPVWRQYCPNAGTLDAVQSAAANAR
jgi:hypothetical protein